MTERALSLDFISVLGLPPVEFVMLAGELGCQHISIALSPITANPHRYPAWSLRTDPPLRLNLLAATRDSGVSIFLGEGFLIRPNADVRELAADLDLMQELNVACVNVLSLESDPARGLDQLATFADMARARDLSTTLEFLPGLPIGDLSSAVAAVSQLATVDVRLLLDAMHVFRSGTRVAQIAALDAQLVGYAQLCDVPWVSKLASYAEEARHERLTPGEGELPLKDFLTALPEKAVVGIEIPMLSLAERGMSPRDRLAACIKAAREMMPASGR